MDPVQHHHSPTLGWVTIHPSLRVGAASGASTVADEGPSTERTLADPPVGSHSSRDSLGGGADLRTPSCLPRWLSVGRQIGQGGMGRVYTATDTRTGRTLAVKASQTRDDRATRALRREFRVLSELVHPNIVAVDELFLDERSCAFTMEWVDGADFDVALRHGSLRDLFGQLARGLADVHDAGLVHGDLKSNNVRVTPEGRVVVLDFGLAQVRTAHRSLLGGTVTHMAPEVLRGAAATVESDVYSVGVMLYQALSGAPPVRGTWQAQLAQKDDAWFSPPTEAGAGVDRALSRLAMAMLSPDPAQRPEMVAIRSALGEARPGGRPLPVPSVAARLLRAALTGPPRSLFVHGTTGAGQTRLVRQEAMDTGARVLWGRCDPMERVSLGGLDGIVDQLIPALGRPARWTDETIARVEAAGRLFPQLIGRPGAVPAAVSLAERQRSVRALGQLLTRAAQQPPLLVVLDSVQWLGRDARAVLDILRAETGETLRWVCTSQEPLAEWRARTEPRDPSDRPPTPWTEVALVDTGLQPASPPVADAPGPEVAAVVAWCRLAGGTLGLDHLRALGCTEVDVRRGVAHGHLIARADARERTVGIGTDTATDPTAPVDPDRLRTLADVLATSRPAWAGAAASLYRQLGDREAAALQAARAGTHALHTGAFLDADALLRSARADGAPVGAWCESLGASMVAHGQTDDALACWRSGRETASPADAIRLSTRIAELELGIGRTTAGTSELERMLATVGETIPSGPLQAILQGTVGAAWRWMWPTAPGVTDDHVRLDALFRATQAVYLVDPLNWMVLNQRFERLALRVGEPRWVLLALATRLWSTRGRGADASATERAIQAHLHAHPHLLDDDLECALLYDGAQAAADSLSGRVHAGGVRYAEVARRWQEQFGNRWEQRFCEMQALQASPHSWPLAISGPQIEDFRARCEELGDIRTSTSIALAAGHFIVLYTTGDPAAATAYAERAIAAWDDAIPPEVEFRICVCRAHLALARGALDEAERILAKAPWGVRMMRSYPLAKYVFDGLWARTLASQPAERRKAGKLRSLLAGLRADDVTVQHGIANAIEAGVQWAAGDLETARRLRDLAVRQLQEAQQHLIVAALTDSDAQLRARSVADPDAFRSFVLGRGAVGLARLV